MILKWLMAIILITETCWARKHHLEVRVSCISNPIFLVQHKSQTQPFSAHKGLHSTVNREANKYFQSRLPGLNDQSESN